MYIYIDNACIINGSCSDIPNILCPASNLSTAYSSNVTFFCTVTSNPFSEISWSAAIVDSSEIYDVNSDSSVTFSVTVCIASIGLQVLYFY